MNLIIIGPPGAGKGTQAERIIARYKVPHYSTGDMLRDAVRAGTKLGLIAGPLMKEGKLVPDDVVIGIISDALSAAGKGRGFLLDGFPRTVAQAEALDAMLRNHAESIDRVVMLDNVPREAILDRITGRRTCPKCRTVYHVRSSPPKVAGICDKDGEALEQRKDDTEEAVVKRLDAYDQWTVDVVKYYDAKGLLRKVNGVGTPDEVAARVQSALS
jgi:adenylate kinase